MSNIVLKICGITRVEDAVHAVREGATAVGFVFVPSSPRYIEPTRAATIARVLPPDITRVGVFVNESPALVRTIVTTVHLGVVQLHGEETTEYADTLSIPVIRAMALDEAERTDWPPHVPLLLDAIDAHGRGGTGRAIDWTRAATIAARRSVILAGGLLPQNVATAIAAVRPTGVDVSSGVEVAPGIKDADKVTEFLAAARAAFAAQR